jgi:tetratricopeptide (TPR) repeat protein/TolB-like protein
MPPPPGQTLGRYRLVEEIGAGGMGVVWKAHDADLDRDVALKLLPESLAEDAERLARFKREARVLAALNHPNIVTIHSVEAEGGVRFLTMELVRGRTLADLRSPGGLRIALLLELLIPLADALSNAHESGITHRDLKPANVMVSDDGRIKILDFGLAKLEAKRPDPERSGSETGVTGDGELVGTLHYMAPEQLDGKPADARSDIFSLGVILYELATGKRPFRGDGVASLMSSIMRDEPPAVTEIRDDLPGDLGRIVRHCLQKDPEQRYQTAKGLRNELKELAIDLATGTTPRPRPAMRRWGRVATIGSALLAVGAIVGAWTLRDRLAGPAADAPPEVLVLPFEVRGQEQGGDLLGLSLAEAVAVDLAPAENLHMLPVVADRAGEDPIEAGRRSRSRYVITGSVERTGTDVSLAIRLIDAEAGRLLDGVDARGEDADLPRLTARLTTDLAGVLGARFAFTYGMVTREMRDPELRVSRELSEYRSAYRDMDLERILETTDDMVTAFPASPEAHAIRVYARVLRVSDDPSEEGIASLEDALRSLERLDPRRPDVDFGRAAVLRARGQHHEGIRVYDRVLGRADLTPAFRAWMLRNRSQLYNNVGDNETALRDARAALDLDPANPWAFVTLSLALTGSGRSEAALEMAQRSVALRPTLSAPHLMVGMTLIDLGRPGEAIDALTRSIEGGGSWQGPVAYLALALRQAGRLEEAEARFVEAEAMADWPDGVFALARERALAGDRSAALELLRRARAVGFADPKVGTVPELRVLHGEPEFEAILTEIEEVARPRALES